MKIDASAPLVADKDGGSPRGGRDDGRTADAARAFGTVIRQVGETRGAAARGAADEVAAEDAALLEHAMPEAEAEDGEEPTAAEGDLRGLLLLMSPGAAAGPAGGASVKPDQTEGEAPPATADVPAPSRDGAEDLEGVAGDRRSQVRVLRTETHFEPRVDGPLADEQRTAPTPTAAAAGTDVGTKDAIEHLAQTLARAVAPAPARTANDAPTDGAAERVLPASGGTTVRATAAGDAPPVPVRFDEAVARLGQPSADTTPGEDGARRERRGDERREAGRTEGATATARVALRGDAPAPSVPDASGGEGATPTPLAGLASQVAARIADALGPALARPADEAHPFAHGGGEASLRLRAGGAALKTLTIQLKPEHLGTLEVSMRLREGKLAIELVASKPEAAAALTQDRETLRKVLEGAGFSMDEAAVTVAVRDGALGRVADAGSAAPSGNGEGRSASGDPSRQGQGAAHRERDRSEPAAQPADAQPRAAPAPAPTRGIGGQTYL